MEFNCDDVCNFMSTGTWKHFKIRNEPRTERGRQSAERKAQSAEDRAQSANGRAQRRAPSADKISLDIKNKKWFETLIRSKIFLKNKKMLDSGPEKLFLFRWRVPYGTISYHKVP